MITAAVIGGGPAGLMAAEVLSEAGARVTVYDHKPTLGRKFLMAGKSGLNLTMDAQVNELIPNYFEAQEALRPMIEAFDASAVQDWVRGLDQEVFTGSTGRVFPTAMKASPLLRGWLARLEGQGVQRQVRWRWTGWNEDTLVFDRGQVTPDVVVLALGGASWARLGSDGAWADTLRDQGVEVNDFGAANVGVQVAWSEHMAGHFGQPIKGVAWSAGDLTSRGEGILSANGLEGGGLYSVARAVRQGAELRVDLLPDLKVEEAARRLSRARGKASLSNHLRKSLKLDALKIAMAQEWARPLPSEPRALAAVLKDLRVVHVGLRALDQAISTSGGVTWNSVDKYLMLNAKPGVFVAGEMLDWEAPTGGYLIHGCLASGRWAAHGALRYLGQTAT